MITEIKILTLDDTRFIKYGKVLTDFDFSELDEYMINSSRVPDEGNIYLASVEEMESKSIFNTMKNIVYGGMDIQIGYCNGNNSFLNGLEYHKGSEINFAVTDFVLQLGQVQDIKNNQYDSKNVKAFFVPKGTTIELYQTTLHFAPCKVSDAGFKCIVILPKGTNTPIENKIECNDLESKILFMKNKWLLAHVDNKVLLGRGAYPGIIGENHKINTDALRKVS
jgi:hypothetical protein